MLLTGAGTQEVSINVSPVHYQHCHHYNHHHRQEVGMACSDIGARISSSGFQTWLHVRITCPEFLHPNQLDQNFPDGCF